MILTILSETYAVSKLDEDQPVPPWAFSGGWWSITRTDEELSIVCPEAQVPETIPANRGWRCLKVAGPLDFSSTGILASLLQPLADADISVFSLSTFDTDYLFVKTKDVLATLKVLSLGGHQVLGT